MEVSGAVRPTYVSLGVKRLRDEQHAENDECENFVPSSLKYHQITATITTMTIITLLLITVHITMRFIICTRDQIISGDQIKMNEMGGARGPYGGHEWCIQGVGGET